MAEFAWKSLIPCLFCFFVEVQNTHLCDEVHIIFAAAARQCVDCRADFSAPSCPVRLHLFSLHMKAAEIMQVRWTGGIPVLYCC